MPDARKVQRGPQRGRPIRWREATLAAAAVLGLNGCDTEEREVEIGYLGEARRNPFLAAQRLCEEYGLSAETRLSIADLPPHHTTLVLSSDAIRAGGSAELIADWVADGGSLIYLFDGGSRFRDDFGDGFAMIPEDEQVATDYLLEYMKVPIVLSDEAESTYWFDGEEFEVDVPSEIAFEADWEIEEAGHPLYRSRFLDFTYGFGNVYLISDAHPFRNRHIGEKDHAAFFWSVINDTGNASVLIVVGGRISFFGLLWSRGWMVVVPVLLALAVWLWKSFPRHGPIQPDEELSKRDFARHVDMLGQFLWRQHAVDELLAPVRRRVRMRLRAATGGEGGREDEYRWWVALAERSGLPLDRVRQALTADPGREPARLVQITRDLHTLAKSL